MRKRLERCGLLLRDMRDLFVPRRCIVCGDRLHGGEKFLCAVCLMRLPLTGHHEVEHSLLEKYFWERLPIERATSFFHYDGVAPQRIIHALKYHGQVGLGRYFATLYAEVLKDSYFFDGIDGIVPLPLHWRRWLHRGYNQSRCIAEAMSKQTGIPVFRHVVERVVNNPSQTTVRRTERGENVTGVFRLTNPERIRGKHILLIDDVVTTGSTLSSCATELMKAGDVRISVLTLAIAARPPVPASDCDDGE